MSGSTPAALRPKARSNAWCVLLVCAATLSTNVQGEVPSQRVDRLLMVVGDRLILESEVELEHRVRDRFPALSPPIPPGTSTLQVLADAAIVRGLAGNTELYRPTTEQVRARQEAIRLSFGDPNEWNHFITEFGLTEDRFASFITGRLIVERYIQRNVALAGRGETEQQFLERYTNWIVEQRKRVAIRLVAPINVGSN